MQKSKMEHHDVLFMRVGPVENCPEVMKCVVVPDHNQDVAGPNAQHIGSQVLARF